MPRLSLRLLGPPQIERDGAPVKVDTRKAIALLAYLAVTGAPHARESLAALLWPESDDSHARAALRRTLSALNGALSGDGLRADRESVRLEPVSDIWVDVGELRARLSEPSAHRHAASEVCDACLPPLEQAAALYRDDFMAGFALRDSPAFDDWQFFQAEGLRRELAGALERLVGGHEARGDVERAIGHGRRWLSLDALHEPAHRYLMRLYAGCGQRNSALRQYRECVRALDRELGVTPLEETTLLYEAIKGGALPSARPRTAAALPDPASDATGSPSAPRRPPPPITETRASPYPMVGRAAELANLLDMFGSIGDDGLFVAIEGEQGIGKTRLAHELLASARESGATVLAARCYEGEAGLAYGPFVEVLRAGISGPLAPRLLEQADPHWLAEAARLLPEVGALRAVLPPVPPLDSAVAQVRFFEGVTRVVLGLCAGAAPGVLFLDDLHWGDEASVDMLTYLVRRLRGRRLLVLATWRSDQVPAGHRLSRLLAEARREGLGSVIALSRLGRDDVAELVRRAAGPGGHWGADLTSRLYTEAEGLPFFVVEYLAALKVAGAEQPAWAMPSTVRDLLHARLASLTGAGQQLLGAAAVIGRSFEFDTLREASGRSDEETLAALEELVARGLVEEMRGGVPSGSPVYDFSHDKLRSVVYDETSLARRRLVHRRVADALVASGRGRREAGPLASQTAYHYRMAGRESEAADYFKLAGEHARSLYANTEALAHYQAALALGHPDTAALHEAIGDLHTLAGRYDAAIASYETAAALRETLNLAVVEHKLGNVHHRRGEWDLSQSYFESALQALGGDGPASLRARVHADWSLTAHRAGRPGRARELAGRALELADAAEDRRALAQAHNILGILAKSRDDLGEATGHLKRSLDLAESLGDPEARVAALNNLALAYGSTGEAERALDLARTALAICVSQGDRHREAALHNNLADLLHASGRSDAAMEHLERAVTIFAEIGGAGGATQPEIWKLSEW